MPFNDNGPELPEKIRELLNRLSGIEEALDGYFKKFENAETGDLDLDDDEWIDGWRHVWRVWPFYPYGPLGPIAYPDRINVIPRRYGVIGGCTDTLLVVIEPMKITFWPAEYDIDTKLRKRLNETIKHIQNCPETQFIVFWASPWEFRIWNQYKNRINQKTVILKPWKMKEIRLL